MFLSYFNSCHFILCWRSTIPSTKLDSTNYSTAGSTSEPTGIENKNYTIYFYIPATNNYYDLSGSAENIIATKYTTLTINPNEGIWDGKAENSTFTEGNGTTKTIVDPTRAGYKFTGWTATEGALFEDGVFTFHITDVTLTANWEKVPPTIEISIDVNEIVYNAGENATLTANAEHELEITYQWYRSTSANFEVNSTTAIAGATNVTYVHLSDETPVGTYYYKAVATANGLSTTSNEVVLNVTKTNNLIIISPVQDLIYNGSEQILLSAIDYNDVANDIYYSIGTELTASNYSTAGTTELPKATNAGEYIVYVYVPECANYEDILTKITVTIEKAENTIKVTTPQGLVFNAQPQVLAIVTDNNDKENDDWEY